MNTADADARPAGTGSAAPATTEQAAREVEAARVSLARLNEEARYLDRLDRLVRTIEANVPAGAAFLLVDDLQLGLGPAVRGRRRAVPFVERDGEYWGAPPDDEAAVAELGRQLAAGVRHVAVAWPSAWYLEHYPRWAARLRSEFRAVVEGPDLSLFEYTRPGPGRPHGGERDRV